MLLYFIVLVVVRDVSCCDCTVYMYGLSRLKRRGHLNPLKYDTQLNINVYHFNCIYYNLFSIMYMGIWRDSLHVTCGLTACTPGSAPGPTLGNEYGKTLPFL